MKTIKERAQTALSDSNRRLHQQLVPTPTFQPDHRFWGEGLRNLITKHWISAGPSFKLNRQKTCQTMFEWQNANTSSSICKSSSERIKDRSLWSQSFLRWFGSNTNSQEKVETASIKQTVGEEWPKPEKLQWYGEMKQEQLRTDCGSKFERHHKNFDN